MTNNPQEESILDDIDRLMQMATKKPFSELTEAEGLMLILALEWAHHLKHPRTRQPGDGTVTPEQIDQFMDGMRRHKMIA